MRPGSSDSSVSKYPSNLLIHEPAWRLGGHKSIVCTAWNVKVLVNGPVVELYLKCLRIIIVAS